MASQQSCCKRQRPQLSLHTKIARDPPSRGLRGQPLDPSDPTTFNTMSNVYVTAIERCSTVPSEPVTDIQTLQNFSIRSPVLEKVDWTSAVVTPFVSTKYPDTPSSARPPSQQVEFVYPSTMTATPPMSAADEPKGVFSFSAAHMAVPRSCFTISSPADDKGLPCDGKTLFPCTEMMNSGQFPYSHPQSLRSILRNSPLPSRTALASSSRWRRSLQLRRGNTPKKVAYDNPLEQEIITYTYIRSHIDLLTEDNASTSPAGATRATSESRIVPDQGMALTQNEIQDGGQTPGPHGHLECRTSGDSIKSPHGKTGCEVRKRKWRKERQWEWTIGQEVDDDEDLGGSLAALRAEAAHKRARKAKA